MKTPTAIYRHWQGERLLYIGITGNPKQRLEQHKAKSVWAGQITRVDVQWLASRDDAIAAERDAIKAENPLFNGGERSYRATGDALRDWMSANRIVQHDIANQFGIKQSTVSRMIAGRARVSLRFAAFIEDWSEGAVPMRYWIFGATAEGNGSHDDGLRVVPFERLVPKAEATT